jgi:hypothetical protein
MTTGLALHLIDKTLPNFIKRKQPREGEKQGQGSKSRQANSPKQPKRGESHGGKETTKYRNFHQSPQAY